MGTNRALFSAADVEPLRTKSEKRMQPGEW